MNIWRLENKKILITGASSGIGRATAIACAEAGAQVMLTGRNVSELEKTLSDMPGDFHQYVPFDLRQIEGFESIFDTIVSTMGKLDGLVYCAGVPGVLPLKVLSKSRMQEIMNVNYFSFIEMVRLFSKKKYSNGGSIVGLSSMVVERGELCQTIYSASKAAMDASVKCLAIELAPKNIRINTVTPGMIRTEMMDKVIEQGSKEEELGKTSVLGIGSPNDVSNAILFLLSELSAHTTGRTVYVDGGCFL